MHLAWKMYFLVVDGLLSPAWQWLLRTFWRSEDRKSEDQSGGISR